MIDLGVYSSSLLCFYCMAGAAVSWYGMYVYCSWLDLDTS